MSALSNWREEFNLSEVVTGKMTDKEALKKVSEKSGISNKVTINPKLDEAVKEIGGEVISMVEQDTTAQKQRLDMKQMILDRQKLKLRRKDMSQKKKEGEGAESTNATKQANVIAAEETVKQVNEKKRKNALQIQKIVGEDYETKKTGEVLAAFKRDPKVRKRFEKAAKKEDGPGSVKNRAADSMLQTAKDTAKRKGDTSKSDDRYAYEEVVLEKDLNAAERRALPDKDFALPGKGKGPEGKQAGSYPIPDEKHARSALSLVAQHGTPEEKATVRAKVKKKFPNIEVNEGVMKMVKKVMSKKKPEKKKATMDAITSKVHDWRKRNSDKQKEHEKYVNFLPVDEAKVDDVKYSKDEKRKNYETDVHTLSVNKGVRADRNKRRSATDVIFHGHSKVERDRKQAHYKSRGVKTKGVKEDKAFEFVKNKLKAKYGDGVLTTGEKMKPPTAAQKKAAAAHREKIAKQQAAEFKKDPSQGRYPKG